MGMCAIKGPVVLHEEEPEDGELSPRSTMSSASRNSISSCNSSSSNSSGYSSASSLELDSSVDAPVWQRSIPKGRRCKPLSFSGMILYDENGKQLEFLLDDLEEHDDDDGEYFSTQRNLAQWEPEFQTPTTVVVE